MYKTYSFRRQDPAVKQVRQMFLDREDDMKKVEVSRLSNLSPNTVYRLLAGKTMLPRNATIEAAGRVFGYKREWVSANGGRRNR